MIGQGHRQPGARPDRGRETEGGEKLRLRARPADSRRCGRAKLSRPSRKHSKGRRRRNTQRGGGGCRGLRCGRRAGRVRVSPRASRASASRARPALLQTPGGPRRIAGHGRGSWVGALVGCALPGPAAAGRRSLDWQVNLSSAGPRPTCQSAPAAPRSSQGPATRAGRPGGRPWPPAGGGCSGPPGKADVQARKRLRGGDARRVFPLKSCPAGPGRTVVRRSIFTGREVLHSGGAASKLDPRPPETVPGTEPCGQQYY